MQSSRILGIGTDIVQLSRIHKVITRNSWAIHKFTRRILSPSELVEWKQKYIIDTANNHDNNLTTDVNIRYLATRWAAKEAIYKAYYPHRILKWSDVSIYKDKGNYIDIVILSVIETI
ncbi:hypothetical protein BDF19DRAFT_411551 [Syncephalis fuscata]|nr:hypothetical protein BDF19DRAFT_411551 [Syncephalis fuscata]